MNTDKLQHCIDLIVRITLLESIEESDPSYRSQREGQVTELQSEIDRLVADLTPEEQRELCETLTRIGDQKLEEGRQTVVEALAVSVAEAFASAHPKTAAAMKRGTWTQEEEAESLAELFGAMEVEGKQQ